MACWAAVAELWAKRRRHVVVWLFWCFIKSCGIDMSWHVYTVVSFFMTFLWYSNDPPSSHTVSDASRRPQASWQNSLSVTTQRLQQTSADFSRHFFRRVDEFHRLRVASTSLLVSLMTMSKTIGRWSDPTAEATKASSIWPKITVKVWKRLAKKCLTTKMLKVCGKVGGCSICFLMNSFHVEATKHGVF